MSDPTSTPSAAIAAALIVAQRAIGAGVEKTKQAPSRGGWGGYKYVSTEDVIAAARAALHSAGLAVLIPSWREVGRDVIEMDAMIVHESGDTWVITPPPTGLVMEGKGRPRDKAIAMALTYGTQYVLRGLLQIPRADEGTLRETPVDDRDDSEHEALPSAGVIRNGRHRGKLIADARAQFLSDYLDALGDGPGAAPHREEIEAELQRRLDAEAPKGAEETT